MAKSFIKFTARLAQVVRVPGKTTEHRDAGVHELSLRAYPSVDACGARSAASKALQT
jgi:hypothetical protein